MLDGLYGWAFYLLLGLFACAVVARVYSRDADTRGLLVPVLSVSPYLLVTFWLLDDLLNDLQQVNDLPIFALVAALVYLICLSIRVLQAAYGAARARAVVVAAVLIVASPWVLQGFDLDTRLWLTDDAAQDEPDDAQTESLLYEQPARIAAALDDLAPQRSGQSDVFFLGFAGFGGQSIFKREALYAEQVLADHFDSGDRSVELINDEEDRDSYPLASVSGLQQALKGLSGRMDLDQDVLVLMLTSHGSADGLAIGNGALPLQQLAPADLRRVLEESGIKWRVIIVSACYSGVFLDAVKNDDTLVITASDAQHSSFGCDDDRDLTYFGEAFLRDSVPTTRTLEDAFHKASGLIHQRETT
ncbi:MAG TPA: C13 family peptidase, partial [Steroidobacteraceae bacterium]|nr:C13 family peptidase [Steroidobacteraceae bacterium]